MKRREIESKRSKTDYFSPIQRNGERKNKKKKPHLILNPLFFCQKYFAHPEHINIHSALLMGYLRWKFLPETLLCSLLQGKLFKKHLVLFAVERNGKCCVSLEQHHGKAQRFSLDQAAWFAGMSGRRLCCAWAGRS